MTNEIKFDKKKEIWKPINGFDGQYEVSNIGRVRSLDRYVFCKSKTKPNMFTGCIIKQKKDKYGYIVVGLKKNQKSYIKKVHRLVAFAFIKNPNNLPTVNHIDGNKENNIFENLEWVSFCENSRHRTKNMLAKPKLSLDKIKDILKNCKVSKNQFDNKFSISEFSRKYCVDRRTVSDILNGKKLYLEKIK